jgi:hypothetical protein
VFGYEIVSSMHPAGCNIQRFDDPLSGEARMKGTDTVVATCMVAGAFVAFLVWFVWDLQWQGLAIGIVVGLILYERMTRQPKSKLNKEKETKIIGLPPTN